MELRRVVLVTAVLVFCLAEVSSNIDKTEEEIPQISQVVRGGNRRLMTDIDCGGLCNARGSLHSRPNRCLRACGTSGNREVRGTCYTGMTTHGNQTKCPQVGLPPISFQG